MSGERVLRVKLYLFHQKFYKNTQQQLITCVNPYNILLVLVYLCVYFYKTFDEINTI
jgi:hypothetical protein